MENSIFQAMTLYDIRKRNGGLFAAADAVERTLG